MRRRWKIALLLSFSSFYPMPIFFLFSIWFPLLSPPGQSSSARPPRVSAARDGTEGQGHTQRICVPPLPPTHKNTMLVVVLLPTDQRLDGSASAVACEGGGQNQSFILGTALLRHKNRQLRPAFNVVGANKEWETPAPLSPSKQVVGQREMGNLELKGWRRRREEMYLCTTSCTKGIYTVNGLCALSLERTNSGAFQQLKMGKTGSGRLFTTSERSPKKWKRMNERKEK